MTMVLLDEPGLVIFITPNWVSRHRPFVELNARLSQTLYELSVTRSHMDLGSKAVSMTGVHGWLAKMSNSEQTGFPGSNMLRALSARGM